MSATDNTIDLNLAPDVATYFALSDIEAEKAAVPFIKGTAVSVINRVSMVS